MTTNWKVFGSSNDMEIVETEEKNLILNGRWTFDPSLGSILLLSKEFLESLLCYTHITSIEWGGFIVGEDLKIINMETGNMCRVLVCERAVVLGQARTGGSFDISEEIVSAWVEDDDYVIPEQSFKTVYSDNLWKKIGWVHSHHTMGTFWSGTDQTTIAEFDMAGIVSIVVAKLGDGIEKRIRADKHDFWFGGVVRPYRDEIDYKFVVEEVIYGGINDIPKETKDYYEDILSKVDVISGVEEAKTTTTTSTTQSKSSYSSYTHGYTVTRNPYSRVMSIDEFLKELAPLVSARRLTSPYGVSLQTDTYIVVNRMNSEEIVDIFSTLYKDTELIGKLDFNFKNFRILLRDFMNTINQFSTERVADLERIMIEKEFPTNWQQLFLNNLEQSKVYTWYQLTDLGDAEDTWKAIAKQIPEDVINAVIDSIYNKESSISVLNEIIKRQKMNYRGDKAAGAKNAVEVMRVLEKVIEILPDDKKEIGEIFIYSLIGDIIEPLIERFTTPNVGIGHIINNLEEDEIGPFLSRYVALYDDSEDLHHLRQLGRIGQYQKEYLCEICKSPWNSKELAEGCSTVCGSKRDSKGDGIKMIEATRDSELKPKTLGELFAEEDVTWKADYSIKKDGQHDWTWKLNEKSVWHDTPQPLDIIISNMFSGDDELLLGEGNSFWSTHNCMYCGLAYSTHALAWECETKCSQILETYFKKRYNLCPVCLDAQEEEEDAEFSDCAPEEYAYNHMFLCDEHGTVMAYILKECIREQNLDLLLDHLEIRKYSYLTDDDKFPLLYRLLLRETGDKDVWLHEFDLPSQYIEWLYEEPVEKVETIAASTQDTKTVTGDLKCSQCHQLFRYEDDLLWHIAEEHDLSLYSVVVHYDGGSIYLDKEELERYVGWATNKVQHVYTNFYVCTYCGKEFDLNSRFLWYLHEKEHRSEEI